MVRGNHRQRAIQAYEQILARWPENVTALRRLAAVELSENNIPQLEALAERLIHTPGGAAIGYTLRGVVAHDDKNCEGAIARAYAPLFPGFSGVFMENITESYNVT